MSAKWHDVFSVSFYRLNELEVQTMEEEIKLACAPLKDGEVLRAVHQLALMVVNGSVKADFRVKVTHIIKRIRANRAGNPENVKAALGEKFKVLSREIVNAPDHARRWSIVCDGTPLFPIITVDECAVLTPALERFCEEQFKDWRRPNVVKRVVHDVSECTVIRLTQEHKPTPEMRKKLRELDRTSGPTAAGGYADSAGCAPRPFPGASKSASKD